MFVEADEDAGVCVLADFRERLQFTQANERGVFGVGFGSLGLFTQRLHLGFGADAQRFSLGASFAEVGVGQRDGGFGITFNWKTA